MLDATDEIEALIQKAATVLRSEGASEVYVFGSAASGRTREGSDLDLAVRGLPAARYFPALARVASEIGRDVDLVDLDRDTPFVRVLKQFGELRRVA